MILGVTDAGENVARSQTVLLNLQFGHCEFDRADLVVVVVDSEVTRQARGSGFTAQKARAQRMKSGDPGLTGRDASAKEQIGNAVAHFLRSFVRKGDGENGFRRHTFSDEVGDAVGDRAGFARARACKNEYRAV